MKTLLAALFTLALAGASFAEVTDSHKEQILKMFKATHQEEAYTKSMTGGFESAMDAQMEQMPAEMQEKMAGAMEKVKALMVEKMGWKVVSPDMIELFAKKYSEEEIKKLLPLLQDETMQAYLKKNVDMLPELMGLGQSKAAALQGDIQKIMMEAMMAK